MWEVSALDNAAILCEPRCKDPSQTSCRVTEQGAGVWELDEVDSMASLCEARCFCLCVCVCVCVCVCECVCVCVRERETKRERERESSPTARKYASQMSAFSFHSTAFILIA